MPTLLQVDVSPRGDYSISSKLSAAYVEQWKSKNPDGKVIRRELAKTPLTFVDMNWIGGAYITPDQHTPEHKQALKLSDELIDELLEANEILIGTPMYNFAVPAALKAWIDHIARYGKTFTIGEKGYQGLAGGRKATFIIASGGNYAPGAPAEKFNHESPYLATLFAFLGITDTKVVHAGGTADVMMGKVSMDEYVKAHVGEVLAAV